MHKPRIRNPRFLGFFDGVLPGFESAYARIRKVREGGKESRSRSWRKLCAMQAVRMPVFWAPFSSMRLQAVRILNGRDPYRAVLPERCAQSCSKMLHMYVYQKLPNALARHSAQPSLSFMAWMAARSPAK